MELHISVGRQQRAATGSTCPVQGPSASSSGIAHGCQELRHYSFSRCIKCPERKRTAPLGAVLPCGAFMAPCDNAMSEPLAARRNAPRGEHSTQRGWRRRLPFLADGPRAGHRARPGACYRPWLQIHSTWARSAALVRLRIPLQRDFLEVRGSRRLSAQLEWPHGAAAAPFRDSMERRAYRAAMTSISTKPPAGMAAAWKALRAGYGWLNLVA